MIEVVANIGLRIDATGEVMKVETVLDACRDCGVIVIGKPAVVNSDTEPTMVLAIAAPSSADVHDLSKQLQQDCIAVYDARNWRGRMIGPKPEAWGDFDPKFFFLSTGKRLSDLVEQQA